MKFYCLLPCYQKVIQPYGKEEDFCKAYLLSEWCLVEIWMCSDKLYDSILILGRSNSLGGGGGKRGKFKRFE